MQKHYLFINAIGKYSPYSVTVFRHAGDETLMHAVRRDSCVYDLEEKLIELNDEFDFESIGISADGEECQKIEALVELVFDCEMHR